jgi:hypothetical protein
MPLIAISFFFALVFDRFSLFSFLFALFAFIRGSRFLLLLVVRKPDQRHQR